MRRTATIAALAGALALATLGPAAAAGPSATITGTVGENVSTTDSYDGRHLRYVGDPAPNDDYSVWYQWGDPYILTETPEDGPVTMAGTIDLSSMTEVGQVAIIGLHDADALSAGDRGEKAEVGIYIAYKGVFAYGPQYTVGLTDGDAGGGEFVQTFVHAYGQNRTLNVEFTVDGTVNPADCATDTADIDTADGCMYLNLGGSTTLTDSYGSIAPDDPDHLIVDTELGSGAVPGWYSAYGEGDGPNVGVTFDLTVSPIVIFAPQSADECRDSGYEQWDFKHQGLCISSVQANENAGK